MAQLSLYLDDQTMDTLRREAGEARTSLSRYVANVLREHTQNRGWPEGWFDLYGILADDDAFAEPEDPPFDIDRPVPALE